MSAGGYVVLAALALALVLLGAAWAKMRGTRAREAKLREEQVALEARAEKLQTEALAVEKKGVQVATAAETQKAKEEILAAVEPIREDLGAQADAVGGIIGAKRKP